MQTLKLIKGNALVLVAHPDDETIWMGGTILAYPDIHWTILCFSRGDDPGRAPRFKKACIQYGARPIISDLEDEGVLTLKESIPEITKRIPNSITKTRFAYLFTHGYNGEYGHDRHKGVHRATKKLITNGMLKALQTFVFSYELPDQSRVAHPKKKSADYYIDLSLPLFKIKQDFISSIYGFSKSSFEYKSCCQIETFKRLR